MPFMPKLNLMHLPCNLKALQMTKFFDLTFELAQYYAPGAGWYWNRLIRQLLIFRFFFFLTYIFSQYFKKHIEISLKTVGSKDIRTTYLFIMSQAALPVQQRGCCAETSLFILHEPLRNKSILVSWLAWIYWIAPLRSGTLNLLLEQIFGLKSPISVSYPLTVNKRILPHGSIIYTSS